MAFFEFELGSNLVLAGRRNPLGISSCSREVSGEGREPAFLLLSAFGALVRLLPQSLYHLKYY